MKIEETQFVGGCVFFSTPFGSCICILIALVPPFRTILIHNRRQISKPGFRPAKAHWPNCSVDPLICFIHSPLDPSPLIPASFIVPAVSPEPAIPFVQYPPLNFPSISRPDFSFFFHQSFSNVGAKFRHRLVRQHSRKTKSVSRRGQNLISAFNFTRKKCSPTYCRAKLFPSAIKRLALNKNRRAKK